MTAAATALLVLAALAAVADWAGVATGRRALEAAAKPLALALLGATAVALQPAHGAVRAWLVAGLACCLVGDVALLGGASTLFVVGLAAFLAGHLAYVTAFAQEQRSWFAAAVGAVVVAVVLATAGRAIVGAVRRGPHPSLAAPVVAYMAALGAMVVTAWGTGRPLAAAGAVAFLASDTVLAWDRFVRPLARGRLATHVTYHLGQAGLVLAMARTLG